MHNAGSIFRTADAVGVSKIYLCGITPGPKNKYGRVNEKFVKVSLGAQNYLPWDYCASTTRLLDKLKKGGYKIFAIEQDKKSISLFGSKIFRYNKNSIAIVLGSEVKGLSPGILKRADKIIEIPQKGKKESLNVAVAFGVVAYQLVFGR